jgi:hypothetical protein
LKMFGFNDSNFTINFNLFMTYEFPFVWSR